MQLTKSSCCHQSSPCQPANHPRVPGSRRQCCNVMRKIRPCESMYSCLGLRLHLAACTAFLINSCETSTLAGARLPARPSPIRHKLGTPPFRQLIPPCSYSTRPTHEELNSRVLIHALLGRKGDDLLLRVNLLRPVINAEDAFPLLLHAHPLRLAAHD
ncbi:hypothetical protein THAOC_03184 [Thalassiosira oceanica]|uniref:Uncharacterized protein n=1 Tax=Thalassiosira oceanica TaxID=159749 RepID=K0T8N8_THAOC|nr:hypothetical protein THAOC_03184 [Thalassiosira oceanica]|eukprot:EJK75103.1 hypothetical protein THAOC_03184 [Thalassiosira oceanica]